MSAVTSVSLSSSSNRVDAPARSTGRTRALIILTVVTAIAVVVGVLLALFYAGTDVEQGHVQRIFYIHVASFFGAFSAFGAAVWGGIAYLRTRNPKWDTLALAGVEVGLALSVINLATGSIWARPIWNTWWTWDPRLTSAAIMAATYAAYLFLRNGIENDETRRRFASVFGILAFSTVIITLVIIRIRPDTIHPAVIGSSPANAQGGFNLTSTMGMTLGYHAVVWVSLLPLVLIWWRIRLENLAERVRAFRAEVVQEA